MLDTCPIRCAPLLALCLFACGDDDTAPPPDGGSPDGGLVGVRAVFEPVADPMPWGVAPFPDDLYLGEDGRVALGTYPNQDESPFPRYTQALLAGFSDLDGFGGLSPVYIPFDGDIDPASLPGSPAASMGEDASVYLLDADPASSAAFTRVPVEIRWLAPERMIALRPADGAPLAAGRRYAAVVTTRVRGVDGAPVRPAVRFADLLAETPTDDSPLAMEARRNYQPVLDNAGIARDAVAALAVFTVQTIEDDLDRIRLQLADAPAPAVTVREILRGGDLDARLGTPDGAAVGLGIEGGVAHDHFGAMVHGSVEVPIYLDEEPGVHGVFTRDAEGGVVVRRTEAAAFTLVLPADAATNPPRLVIFQHGITSERSDALGIANALAGAGYATLAIDAPYHGMRSTMGRLDTRNRFTGEDVPDGFGDLGGSAIILDFAGLQDTRGDLIEFHPIYFRDALRQSAADLLALVRAVRGGNFDGVGGGDVELADFRFSDMPLAFIGNSLGGIIGTIFVATEPEIGAAVLAVTGGNLTLLVQQSPSFNSAYLPQLFPLFGLEPGDIDYDARPPIFTPELALWQTQLDRGDSGMYGRRLGSGRAHVLMLMSQHDETVNNINTESLAGAIGVPTVGEIEATYVDLPVASLPLRGNVARDGGALTRGLFIHAPATHGLILYPNGESSYDHPVSPPFERLEPTPVRNPVEQAQGQIVNFLETWRAGAPEIGVGD